MASPFSTLKDYLICSNITLKKLQEKGYIWEYNNNDDDYGDDDLV